MTGFTKIISHAAVLSAENVDTDQIIPARFLKVTDKAGLGDKLFHDWRYLADGKPNPDFPLNRPESNGAEILVAGANFGCGSSREHAPWALCAAGFRAVVSTSFADIFRGNALKNGLLPVLVAPDVHGRLLGLVRANPASVIEVDLESQTLTLPGGSRAKFPVDAFAKDCLLSGTDELGYLLSLDKEIAVYEQRG